MESVELVSPGGSYFKGLVAALFGADAVYIGVPFTSLRMRQNDIVDLGLLEKTTTDIKKLGKKVYFTMNIFPRNIDIKVFEYIIDKIISLNPDAIIFSDPGVYRILKKYNVNLHLSTQGNTLNYEAVRFWEDLGIKRVILARELSLEEIKTIREKTNVEIEIFVHGSMCMAYSGRCFLGEYFSARDGNKGECSHVCRFNFKLYLEEKERPGKLYEITEDEEGTYILSSKDLCTIEKLNQLIGLVDGFKIEGRSKSEFYVGAVTLAYRHMIDHITKGIKLDENIKNLVYLVPHRYYWDGFYFNGLKYKPEISIKDEDYEKIPDDDIRKKTYDFIKEKLALEGLNSITLNKSGPINKSLYKGFLIGHLDQEDDFFQILPKDTLFTGFYNILTPKGIEKVKILNLYDKNKNIVERLTVNEYGYVKLDKPFIGYNILLGKY